MNFFFTQQARVGLERGAGASRAARGRDFVSRDMPEPSAQSPEPLGPPGSYAPKSADFLTEGGEA